MKVDKKKIPLTHKPTQHSTDITARVIVKDKSPGPVTGVGRGAQSPGSTATVSPGPDLASKSCPGSRNPTCVACWAASTCTCLGTGHRSMTRGVPAQSLSTHTEGRGAHTSRRTIPTVTAVELCVSSWGRCGEGTAGDGQAPPPRSAGMTLIGGPHMVLRFDDYNLIGRPSRTHLDLNLT